MKNQMKGMDNLFRSILCSMGLKGSRIPHIYKYEKEKPRKTPKKSKFGGVMLIRH